MLLQWLMNAPRKAVITMRSSNLTPARELNNLISNLRMTDDKGSFQPAAYSAIFKLKLLKKMQEIKLGMYINHQYGKNVRCI